MSLEMNLKVIRDGGGSPQARLVFEHGKVLFCACCNEEVVKDEGDMCPACQLDEAEYHERQVDDEIERKHGGSI